MPSSHPGIIILCYPRFNFICFFPRMESLLLGSLLFICLGLLPSFGEAHPPVFCQVKKIVQWQKHVDDSLHHACLLSHTAPIWVAYHICLVHSVILSSFYTISRFAFLLLSLESPDFFSVPCLHSSPSSPFCRVRSPVICWERGHEVYLFRPQIAENACVLPLYW